MPYIAAMRTGIEPEAAGAVNPSRVSRLVAGALVTAASFTRRCVRGYVSWGAFIRGILVGKLAIERRDTVASVGLLTTDHGA